MVPGTFVWSKWFEERQQSQRLRLYVVQLHEYGHSLGACCLVIVVQRTKAVPGTVLCTTVWIWPQSWGMLFGHYGSKDDSSPRDCVVHHRMGMAMGSSPRDCVVHHHMNKITVFGTVCSILVNLGNDPRDCLVNMFPRRASVPGTVLCTTIWIRLQSRDNTSLTKREQLQTLLQTLLYSLNKQQTPRL